MLIHYQLLKIYILYEVIWSRISDHEPLTRDPVFKPFLAKCRAFDPSNKDAYSLIGNLYMGSFEECKQGEKKTHDYAIFIAAHKMFRLAGDSGGMAKAKALFPSIEDIFNDEYAEGDTYQVGCWINESVVIERRSE